MEDYMVKQSRSCNSINTNEPMLEVCERINENNEVSL